MTSTGQPAHTTSGVDKYLESQAEAGVFESNREFSVNIIAAQQKLGRYSLPRESAWILKFVQAATELGCPQLHLWFTKDEIVVEFPEPFLTDILSLRNRLETLSPQNLAEDHLFGGLLALHALGGSCFVDIGAKRWYPAESPDFEEIDPKPRTRVVYQPDFSSLWQKLFNRPWLTSNLLQELRDNCYSCPVELVVDSRALDAGADDLPLISGLVKGKPGGELDYYGQIKRDTGNKKRTFCQWGSRRPNPIGYAIQARITEGKAKSALSLEWIRSGVVVKRQDVTLSGRRLLCRILIPTRGLQFDASGFAIQDNEEARERQALGAAYLEHAVEAIRGELHRHNRFARFLERNYPEVRVPSVDDLTEQLDLFVIMGQRKFGHS